MAAFGIPGGYEWLIILVVVLLIFGPTQLPKLAKMIGKSAKSLKEGIDGKLDDDDDEKKPAAPETVDAPDDKKKDPEE
jgi:sec-independent protein translocase protein TatA